MNERKVFEYVCRKVEQTALEQIRKSGRPIGVTASEIEQEFQIYRSNASAILNQLVKKQKLVKIDSRPVYFLPADILQGKLNGELRPVYSMEEFLSALEPVKEKQRVDDPFSALIGHDSSLSHQIDQAKAAILYPPKGLHTLLIGESGTGKTLFAKAMYNYGLKQPGRNKKNFPFVEFNCADYYHNPQLLMSNLFGHVKGAFTGATQERAGLVAQADGGILFLDEIHRLPPEGQELLFCLMDTGSYRRLGETTNSSSAQVLIIGATTEDPKRVLPKTFMRRIPLTIKLPAYREKNVSERIQLIEHIFMRESTATQRSYLVSSQIIKALSAYPFSENIGQLSSEIKVLCARSFFNNIISNEKLVVSYDNLSPYIREYIEKKWREVEETIPNRYNSDMVVEPSNSVVYNYSKFNDEKAYHALIKNIEHCISIGMAKEEIDEALETEIRDYCRHILQRYHYENVHKEEMYKVIHQEIVDFTMETAERVFERLDLEMTQKNIMVLAFHFKFLLERLSSRKGITKTEMWNLEQGYYRELSAAEEIVECLEKHFQVAIPGEEKYFIAILLSNMQNTPAHSRPGLVIVAHSHRFQKKRWKVCQKRGRILSVMMSGSRFINRSGNTQDFNIVIQFLQNFFKKYQLCFRGTLFCILFQCVTPFVKFSVPVILSNKLAEGGF